MVGVSANGSPIGKYRAKNSSPTWFDLTCILIQDKLNYSNLGMDGASWLAAGVAGSDAAAPDVDCSQK